MFDASYEYQKLRKTYGKLSGHLFCQKEEARFNRFPVEVEKILSTKEIKPGNFVAVTSMLNLMKVSLCFTEDSCSTCIVG